MPDTAIDPEIAARFIAIVGEGHAVTDPHDLEPYLVEPRGRYAGVSRLVLRPANVDEVSQILKLASETGTAIVPQGGNTGLVGAQMPDNSGTQVILSLSRLNRIREIDLSSNTMTVEAGVVLETIQTAADDNDRLFPLSLGSQGSCQIGGNLSSNAGGTGVLAYGNARELCLGVEVVLPTGEVLDDLRKLKKDNTGYDLKNLFVGAEGTLGIITAAIIKLVPKPKGREVAWIGLPDPKAALDLFTIASSAAGASLTAFELMQKRSLDFTLKHIPDTVSPLQGEHDWYVLMEISSGRSAEDARGLIEEIVGAGLEEELVEDAALAMNLAQAGDFWRLRESMSESQRPEGGSIKHDVSVPIALVPEFIEKAAAVILTVVPGARMVCFGHMGDGNLHLNVSQPEGADKEEFLSHDRAMHDAVHAIVRAMNGSISAEHGIGIMKRDELLATAPPLAIDLMRRIKASFDPAGIMNPGKMI
ncbi:FAD-binding protein [Aliihoeflea aestuarii]|uniref:FAD-binding oxidoreductase n=1 Tax=Aliihoeflea aestuarii TaxID=453840 RepID=UPI002094A4D5|nr:FAD-binding oxidoreductase [Aliihoeflea aestuarii]MCO6392076.1 FAD-binding protein [Aliihoeflea aestuarii]